MKTYKTTNQAADKLHVAAQTLRVWRLRGVGPKYVKPSRSRVLYADEDLEAFLLERTYSSTSEESTRRASVAAA